MRALPSKRAAACETGGSEDAEAVEKENCWSGRGASQRASGAAAAARVLKRPFKARAWGLLAAVVLLLVLPGGQRA